MTEKETIGASTLEDVSSIPSSSVTKLPESGSHERMLAERKLVRKLDMRLLPTIFLIFILNYIDVWGYLYFICACCALLWINQRNGVTTARLKGMQQDLHINGTIWLRLFERWTDTRMSRRSICNSHCNPFCDILPCTNPFEHGMKLILYVKTLECWSSNWTLDFEQSSQVSTVIILVLIGYLQSIIDLHCTLVHVRSYGELPVHWPGYVVLQSFDLLQCPRIMLLDHKELCRDTCL